MAVFGPRGKSRKAFRALRLSIMRFTRYPKGDSYQVTPRKLAAARRAVQRQKGSLSVVPRARYSQYRRRKARLHCCSPYSMWASAACRALCDDARLLKAEILASPRGWGADNDVVHQIDLQDSGGFENSPGETHIGFRRARITGWLCTMMNE
jgi:hypothetical protein